MKNTVAILAAILFLPLGAFAQDSQRENPYNWNQKHKAREVVYNQLSHNDRQLMRVCQNVVPVTDCKRRINALVNAIFSSSQRHNVNPWAMVALAYETTGFDAFHTDRTGFTGVIAIPLRVSFRRQNPFFRNRTYRENCQNEADACQVEIIEHAISRIAETMERYDEPLIRTLQRFSRKNATNERIRFARHVRRRTHNLRAAATLIEDLDICSVHRMACSD